MKEELKEMDRALKGLTIQQITVVTNPERVEFSINLKDGDTPVQMCFDSSGFVHVYDFRVTRRNPDPIVFKFSDAREDYDNKSPVMDLIYPEITQGILRNRSAKRKLWDKRTSKYRVYNYKGDPWLQITTPNCDPVIMPYTPSEEDRSATDWIILEESVAH